MRRHTCADGSFEWYVLNGHTRRRAKQILSDESSGCSGAGEVAGEARAGQGTIPQANAVTRTGPQNIAPAAPRLVRDGASYERREMQSENQSPVAAFLFFVERLP